MLFFFSTRMSKGIGGEVSVQEDREVVFTMIVDVEMNRIEW